jgi:uncharacterized membrane protein YkoI
MKTLAKLISACLLVASAAAWADISREDAAAIAQRNSGGRVLSVDRADAGGRPAWRVKVVTPSGDVRVILLDAATGRPV